MFYLYGKVDSWFVPKIFNGILNSKATNSEIKKLNLDNVVVNFRRVMRPRHVSYRLKASLLCQWAQLTYKPNMGSKKSLRTRPEPTDIWSDIT